MTKKKLTNIEEIQDDISKFAVFEAMSNSEGGKVLLKLCLSDMASSVYSIANGYTKLSHIEMIAYAAQLKERLDMYGLLNNAKINTDLAREALKEALTNQD